MTFAANCPTTIGTLSWYLFATWTCRTLGRIGFVGIPGPFSDQPTSKYWRIPRRQKIGTAEELLVHRASHAYRIAGVGTTGSGVTRSPDSDGAKVYIRFPAGRNAICSGSAQSRQTGTIGWLGVGTAVVTFISVEPLAAVLSSRRGGAVNCSRKKIPDSRAWIAGARGARARLARVLRRGQRRADQQQSPASRPSFTMSTRKR
jgi:hypothetical protein